MGGSCLWAQMNRGRILGRNWDKSLDSFLHCYSQSPLLTDFVPPHPPPLPPEQKKWVETGCNVNIVYGNLKPENSEDCAYKVPWFFPKEVAWILIQEVPWFSVAKRMWRKAGGGGVAEENAFCLLSFPYPLWHSDNMVCRHLAGFIHVSLYVWYFIQSLKILPPPDTTF